MDQRRPRLGDIVDDYCPRERRLANHVVVAMIGDDIKQTRCTTCDAEHAYKHAKVPSKRKKSDSPAALVKQVAEGLQEKPRLNGDLGAPAPAPELGAMAARGLPQLLEHWWIPVIPGMAVFLLAFVANLAGDGLRDLIGDR